MNTNCPPIQSYGFTECRGLVDKFILRNGPFALSLAHSAVPIAELGYRARRCTPFYMAKTS